jgi:RNase H-like domain found in reverse transcriptase
MIPAAFYSQSLNSAEKNYPMHDKEMLSIVDCLKLWEPQLTGTWFEVLTDHKPLTHFKTQRDLSPQQIRWNEALAQFDIDIHYIPGISNSAADALSRYPYVQTFDINAVSSAEFDPNILSSVKANYEKDPLFGFVIKNPENYPLYEIRDGLIFFEGRLCILSKD